MNKINREEVCMLNEDHGVNTVLDSVAANQQVRGPIGGAKIETNVQKNVHVGCDQIKKQFFNELLDDQSMSGNAGHNIENWLFKHSLNDLHKLNDAAKSHFLYEGITFSVYGDQDGVERSIPFDVIPRIIAKKNGIQFH